MGQLQFAAQGVQAAGGRCCLAEAGAARLCSHGQLSTQEDSRIYGYRAEK